MNRFYYIPVLSLLISVGLFGCLSEDPNSLDPADIFIKYYGSDQTEEVVDLLALNDGYLLLGTRTSTDNTDFYLVRTDSAGNRLWEGVIEYDTVGTTDIPSKMLLHDNDQKLYIIGTSTFDRGDDNLTKVGINHLLLVDLALTNTGFTVTDTLLYRYYDDRSSDLLGNAYVPSLKGTSGADILDLGEGELILLGSVESGSNDPANDDNSILLLKLSLVNNTISWERPKGFAGDDLGKRLIEANGNYYYVGSISGAGVGKSIGGVDIVIEQFELQSGSEDNQRVYGTVENDEVFNVIQTTSGLALTGTTGVGNSQYAFLLQVSVNLGLATLKTLTYPNGAGNTWNTQGADLIQTVNGDYFIVGQVNAFSDIDSNPRENDIMVLSTNSFGEVYEGDVQVYGSSANDAGNAIILRPDGTMVIGATVHFGGSATMLSLMKTNRYGELLRN